MKILGIETSCDETAAAIVENGTKIISNVVASSAEMHAKTGGVIPEFAAREQLKSILPVIKEALVTNIDAIAVTVGPGLIGSLLVGVETAKTLSYLWKKPIIPVNHLVGHIYANWLNSTPEFPALALVVSGGHTDLVLMKSHKDIKYLGGTRDDAAGEAFDKTARLLGLPYPGGPAISESAKKFRDQNPDFKLDLLPRPMINEENYDFSFSGLKTAVANVIKNTKDLKHDIPHISAEVEQAIVETLVEKTCRAIEEFSPKSFLLAGGVAANSTLKMAFEQKMFSPSAEHSAKLLRSVFHVPPVNLCTDNAAYIAAAAYFHSTSVNAYQIHTQPELTITDSVEV